MEECTDADLSVYLSIFLFYIYKLHDYNITFVHCGHGEMWNNVHFCSIYLNVYLCISIYLSNLYIEELYDGTEECTDADLSDQDAFGPDQGNKT